jgi:hypothetical protein
MKIFEGIVFLFAFILTVNGQLVEIKPTDNWGNYVEVNGHCISSNKGDYEKLIKSYYKE